MADDPEWPEDLPVGCPPEDASPAEGELFYLSSEPPCADDMKTAADRGAFKDRDECERRALSCWKTQKQADELRLAVPRLRDRVVSYFSLNADHGVLKPTGRVGHHSLWLRLAYIEAAHELLTVA